jgi:CHASE3 domain sensor protein
MMHKDMQTIETAARTTMAGYYEPQRQENAVLRTGFYVTAASTFLIFLILLFV